MEMEDRAEMGDMSRLPISMKVRVIALSVAFLVVVGLGLWASSPLIVRCLETIQEYAGLPQAFEAPGDQLDGGSSMHVLLLDGFDQENPVWQRRTSSCGTGTIALQDRCMFLNLSEESSKEEFSKVWLNYGDAETGDPWLYVDVEIRLRCSDDNGLESDVYGGMRCWGLMEGTGFPSNSILFSSESPQSDAPGFFVKAHVDGPMILNEQLVGIDVAEWHTYTILWGPWNSTVLVDGVVVATIDETPSVPMAVHIQAENSRYGKEGEYEATDDLYLTYVDLQSDVWIQMGSVQVEMAQERYHEYSNEVLATLGTVSQRMDAAREYGIPIDAIQQISDDVMDDWAADGFAHAGPYQSLVDISDKLARMLEHADELLNLFSSAKDVIRDHAASEGEDSRKLLFLNQYLRIAEDAWGRYDYETTKYYLESIVQSSS